jgi:hypothetical protein
MMSIEQAVGIQQGYFDFDPDDDVFEMEERIFQAITIEDRSSKDFLLTQINLDFLQN